MKDELRGLGLLGREHLHRRLGPAADDAHRREPKVEQRAERGGARRVGGVAAVVEERHVAADGPDALARDDAERLDVHRLRLTEGPLEQPHELDGGVGRPAGLVRRRGHRRELDEEEELPLSRPVGKGLDQLRADRSHHLGLAEPHLDGALAQAARHAQRPRLARPPAVDAEALAERSKDEGRFGGRHRPRHGREGWPA